jgi:hypothetical protein
MRLRVRWPFVVLLTGVAVWGFFANRENARRESEILAITTCPFRGEPVTRVSEGLSLIEIAHVTAHEGVHAQQCRDLGPVKYRLRNLTSKLSLEAPAYCAGAAARLALGMDSAEVRMRLVDDAVEAMRRTADSANVVAALGEACPAILRRKRPAPGRIRV